MAEEKDMVTARIVPPTEPDEYSKAAVEAADAAAKVLDPQSTPIVVLVLLGRPDGTFCAQVNSRRLPLSQVLQYVQSWVITRACRAFGN